MKLKDYEVRDFADMQAVKDFLQYGKEDDVWYESVISKCKAFYYNGKEPVEEFMQKNKLNVSAESVNECIDDAEIFISFVHKGKRLAYPARYTTIKSMLERAGFNCRAIAVTEERPQQRVLPIEDRVAIINKGFKLYDNSCKILVRDEKISAMLSNQYAILPDYELEEALTNLLEAEYPCANLIGGRVSHEFIELEYDLYDEELEEDFRSRLEDFGINVDKVTSGVKFLTSDIGHANANVYPYFVVDGKRMRCGKDIEVKHFGKKTVEDFAKKLPQLNSLYKQNLPLFERMCETEIIHPADCLRAIACEVRLPKKLTVKYAENVDMIRCSGFEIYFMLHEIVELYREENPGASIVSILSLQEAAASALYYDFKTFDHPFEWKKGEMD